MHLSFALLLAMTLRGGAQPVSFTCTPAPAGNYTNALAVYLDVDPGFELAGRDIYAVCDLTAAVRSAPNWFIRLSPTWVAVKNGSAWSATRLLTPFRSERRGYRGRSLWKIRFNTAVFY